MYVTILGSCANQTANREGVSMIIESENTNILIDTGPGIVSSINKLNRSCSDVNNVLLTHVHGDHVSGFAYFVWNRLFEHMGKNTNANDLNVYGKKDTIELATLMLSHSYPALEFPFKINFHIVNDFDSIIVEDLEMKIIPANHTVPTISCVIKSKNKKLVYSSDTLPTNMLIEESLNADLLLHEGMFTNASNELSLKVKHSTAKNAGEFAKKTSAKQLLIVHISPEFLGKEKKLLSEANEEYNGPISIPTEGSIYIV